MGTSLLCYISTKIFVVSRFIWTNFRNICAQWSVSDLYVIYFTIGRFVLCSNRPSVEWASLRLNMFSLAYNFSQIITIFCKTQLWSSFGLQCFKKRFYDVHFKCFTKYTEIFFQVFQVMTFILITRDIRTDRRTDKHR